MANLCPAPSSRSLIPEASALSIVAGVGPKVGLFASFCIAVITAIVGGRPGMISDATGAMALVMVTPPGIEQTKRTPADGGSAQTPGVERATDPR